MSRYRGTVQGGRGEGSRLGHASSGLKVEAQSWQGKIVVSLYAHDEGCKMSDDDWCSIYIAPHGSSGGDCRCLYFGPLMDLFEPKTLVQRLAEKMLEEQFGG